MRSILLASSLGILGIAAALPFRHATESEGDATNSEYGVSENQRSIPPSFVPLEIDAGSANLDPLAVHFEVETAEPSPTLRRRPDFDALPASYDSVAVPMRLTDTKNLLNPRNSVAAESTDSQSSDPRRRPRFAFDRFGVPRPILEETAGERRPSSTAWAVPKPIMLLDAGSTTTTTERQVAEALPAVPKDAVRTDAEAFRSARELANDEEHVGSKHGNAISLTATRAAGQEDTALQQPTPPRVVTEPKASIEKPKSVSEPLPEPRKRLWIREPQ